ncbi:MAG TPA: cytochrome c3 family protein [Vicinamibacterales bacterium]|nr:cytochrome c3 family protein [Vicinamibacterales bacterium]
MANRFGHYTHIVRMAGLFAAGFLVFLFIRWALIPADFGVYGFYRAGALDDARARPASYVGESTCLDCHGQIGDERQGSKHAQVHCEACHGPLAKHASGDFEIKPRALNPRTLCLTCHTQLAGKPADFPQIDPADHGGDGACTECHKPHHPKIG